jgi:predicted  nucleic acid-binding Zn-ribbon protein
VEKVAVFQQTLKTKQKQLAAMEEELLAQKDHMSDARREIEMLNNQIQALEGRYIKTFRHGSW